MDPVVGLLCGPGCQVQAQRQYQWHRQFRTHVAGQHDLQRDVARFRGKRGVDDLATCQEGTQVAAQPVDEGDDVGKLQQQVFVHVGPGPGRGPVVPTGNNFDDA